MQELEEIISEIINKSEDSGGYNYMLERFINATKYEGEDVLNHILYPFFICGDMEFTLAKKLADKYEEYKRKVATDKSTHIDQMGSNKLSSIKKENKSLLSFVDVMFKEVKTDFVDPYMGIRRMALPSIPESSVTNQDERKVPISAIRYKIFRLEVPKPVRIHSKDETTARFMLELSNVSIQVAGITLINNGEARFIVGKIYGLVGKNGIGKSTFLSWIACREIPNIPKELNIGMVEQEPQYDDKTPLEAVLEVDKERNNLLNRYLTVENDPTKEDEYLDICKRLAEIQADMAVPEVNSILTGLGFSEEMKKTPISKLSGGWRIRVNLARIIFAKPDVILLDEPTNHLDIEAIDWLSDYLLTNNSGICIIVSHSQTFLDTVCSDILLLENKTLVAYPGNYSEFEEEYNRKQIRDKKEMEIIEKKKQHMQSFVDRFRYNSKRASLAQSRLKAIAKLPMFSIASRNTSVQFNFSNVGEIDGTLVEMKDVSFRYSHGEKSDYLLKNLNLSLDRFSRLAICGKNGSGKSTIIKLINENLKLTSGDRIVQPGLRIGYYTQYHADNLDIRDTPVDHVRNYILDKDKATVSAARAILSGFGIDKDRHLEPIGILSHGQRSKVALAAIASTKPHILLLDEPTNHLDMETIQALISGLLEFDGGVLVVSHDAHFINCVCDEIWYVDPKRRECLRFDGTFSEYRKFIARK